MEITSSRQASRGSPGGYIGMHAKRAFRRSAPLASRSSRASEPLVHPARPPSVGAGFRLICCLKKQISSFEKAVNTYLIGAEFPAGAVHNCGICTPEKAFAHFDIECSTTIDLEIRLTGANEALFVAQCNILFDRGRHGPVRYSFFRVDGRPNPVDA
ncbi:hypothetical protein [Rhizobium mongolense]|uniref:hypothetical protein n=1 Tax=Rhizobium mongolense TaxID=57676 RepID=UPI001428D6C4|nr:hypothetical protein [Rhizobium mongolense]